MSELMEKLRRARILISISQAGTNLVCALAVVIVSFWLMALINSFLWLNVPTRGVLFAIWLGISAVAILIALIPPLARPPSLRFVAMEFEKYFPQLREHLIAAYDLANENISEYGYSPALVDAVVRRAASTAAPLSCSKLLPSKRAIQNTALLCLGILIVIGSAFAFPQKFPDGTIRMLNPFTGFTRPTKTVLAISMPESGKALRFSDYAIEIRASGEIPDKIWIYRKLGKQGFSPFEARRDPIDRALFRYSFRKLAEDAEFYAIGGDYKSGVHKVIVLDLPRIMDIALEYRFPPYTCLAAQRVDRNDGNIDALYGTKVTIETIASKNITHAEIQLSDSTRIPMRCNKTTATGTIAIRKNGSYSIQVWDSDGNFDPQPPQYSIRVQPDEAPVVQIMLPGRDVDINEEMKLPMQVYAEDDFGFSKFLLKFYVSTRDSTVDEYGLPFSLYGKKQVVLEFAWDISPLGLIPDDVVKYWIEGYDNDIISGPKFGKSKVYAVRFPSIDEIIDEVTGEQHEQTEAVDEALQHQKEIAERMEEMARNVQKQHEKLPYEQREEIQRLLEQQQQLAQNLEETAEQMRETIERIEENRLASQQIIEKMWQIQEILQEILPEELKKAMQKLQEAMKNLDPELMKQAMKQFQSSQQELLQKLDHTLELLKRIQVEMQLDELKKLANRIEELQDKINKGLESGQDTEQLQRMESETKKQLEKFQQQANELAKKMQEYDDMPADEMQKLAEQIQEQNLPSNAQEAITQMQQGNCKGAQKSGQNISSAMQKTAKQLQELQQKMNQMLQQELTMDITRTVQELLYISGELEALQIQLDRTRAKQDIIELASKQAELREVLQQSIARVGEIGGKTFLLPPAVAAALVKADAAMSDAAHGLSQGMARSASKSQRDALGGVNSAAEILLRSMDSMCQSSSSSGMQQLMQQLQNMCNKQGQINQQSIPLAGACNNPGGMTPEQMAAASRLSAEQQALRKSMEEMRKEFEQHSNLLGRMENTIDEMKKVEEDLGKFEVGDKTLQRQDRILSRMLDAQKSLHKREFTEKRRSRSGEDVVRKSPDQLPADLGERRDVLQHSLLQILSNPYPKQYQQQVRKYFRALEKQDIIESENK